MCMNYCIWFYLGLGDPNLELSLLPSWVFCNLNRHSLPVGPRQSAILFWDANPTEMWLYDCRKLQAQANF